MKFDFSIPVQLTKSETDDYFEIEGLASTEDRDLQGEIVAQNGLDLSDLDTGKGYINADHGYNYKNKDHARMGLIDSYKMTDEGLWIRAKVWKDHPEAKTYLNELKHGPNGLVKFSVEGQTLERDAIDRKKVRKAKVFGVALTRNAVNTKTYAQLVKSLATDENQDFFYDDKSEKVTYTAEQVSALLKALGISQNFGTTPPAQLSGGSAMQKENLDKQKKKKRKLKKMSEEECASKMEKALNLLQISYSDKSRDELWEMLKTKIEENL